MYCSKKYVPGAVKVRIKRQNKSKAFYVCYSEINNTCLSWYDNNNNYVKFVILYKDDYKEFIAGTLPFYIHAAEFFKGDTVSCRGWTINLDSNYAFQKFIHNLETECVLS